MRNILLAAIASFGAVGCVGGLEGTDPTPTPPPPDNATAKELFDATVAPITLAKCAGCHTTGSPNGNVTGFVDPVAATAYATITGYVAVVGSFDSGTAPILTKIAGGHQGLSYTQTQLSQITAWLDKEYATRNPNTAPPTDPTVPPPPETASQANKRLLKQWSGCMTKTDFDTANMAGNVGGWQTNNNQECDNCHATGAEGMIASRDVGGGGQTFFDAITQHSSYMQQYFIVDMSAGIATASVKMNRASFDGVSQRKAPHVEHPTFDSTDNGQGIQAISQFYTLTQGHVATPTTCEVPAGRLID